MAGLEQKIKCPLIKVPSIKAPSVPLCEPRELDELCGYVGRNQPWSGGQTFERGSITGPGRLDLCKQGIGASGTERIVKALKENQHIKHILLGTDSLGDKGANILAQHISEDQYLETVHLGCNVISESGAAALAQSLAQNTNVKSLWLKRNPIGNEGAKSIANMLLTNTSLRTLDLVNTGIDNEGIELIADALIQGASQLEAIYLGGNQLDNKSIEGVVSLLSLSSLKALFLNVNSLGSEFLKAILEKNPCRDKLINLGLASNGIDINGLHTLFEVGGDIQFKSVDLGYARSTKILGGCKNFFGDLSGNEWNSWLQSQPSLESLHLNETGVGHNTVCKIIETVKSHHSLHTLSLSKTKNSFLRQKLNTALEPRFNMKGAVYEEGYLRDVSQIKSVYR